MCACDFVFFCITVDDVALIWINGTKSIMTDALITSTDPRVKAGIPIDKSDHTLVIEQVTRWDSGSYTCKITSSPPVEIMHTLHVTRQYFLLNYIFYYQHSYFPASFWRRLRGV